MPTAKTNEPITLDALPAGSVVELQGKKYPTHAGLLALAHAHGMTSMTTDVLSYQDGEAVVKATCEGSRGIYTGHGDASPANVNRNIASAVLRMAETRSQNRAMRAYLGLGATTLEEMPPEALQGGAGNRRPAATRQQPQRAQSAPSAPSGPPSVMSSSTNVPDCPKCQGPMWNNVEKRKQQQDEHDAGTRKAKPGPAYKCKDQSCATPIWDAPADGGDDGIPF